ncbi:tetratricopeptide repeat protein [Ningiella sp. W23]|uniref:tetratricopeptide repeat protein n=1 Tax=Ningiella sp. W23 TaxID=3023715 RepID=UPI003757EE6C
MSVVNKMLQDLEARRRLAKQQAQNKQGQAFSADYVTDSASANTSKRELNNIRFRKPLMFVLGLGTLVCAIALFWQNQNLMSALHQQEANQALIADSLALHAKTQLDNAALVAKQRQTQLTQQNKNVSGFGIASVDNLPGKTEQSVDDTALDNDSNNTSIEMLEPRVNDDGNQTLIVAQQLTDEAPPLMSNNAYVSSTDVVNQASAQQAEEQAFRVLPSSGDETKQSILREQARVALIDNDIGAAISALSTLVELYPQDSRARKQLASVLFSRQAYEQASIVLKAGLPHAPADSDMRVMLARLLYKTGEYSQALQTLKSHPYPHLADIELISFRAALGERMGEYSSAYEDYTLLTTREPNNAKWWLGLGVSQDKLSMSAQAIESYYQVQNLNQLPTDVNQFVEQRIAVLTRQI